MLINFFKKFSF